MGRFSVETSLNNPQQNSFSSQQTDWPTTFPKESIGIEMSGVILEENSFSVSSGNFKIKDNSLTAIRNLRMKGYKVFLYFNEPLVSINKVTTSDVDSGIQSLMQIFGQAGIFSIEGILYSTTSLKEDMYVFPNNGMLKRAEKEFNQRYKDGYFVSNNIKGLKAGFSMGAKPILISSNAIDQVQDKLNTFANRSLKTRVSTYDDLLSFSNELN